MWQNYRILKTLKVKIEFDPVFAHDSVQRDSESKNFRIAQTNWESGNWLESFLPPSRRAVSVTDDLF